MSPESEKRRPAGGDAHLDTDSVTAGEADPLTFARRLIDQGVPVFVARPDRSPLGYRLPTGWQQTKPSPALLAAWQPGDALCAVGGHALDVIDVDPRNGGDKAAEALRVAGAWPREYAVVSTPSGGTHHFVASLGAAKAKRDGIDFQGGAPDGTGRGFVFLPPTVREAKDGVRRPYTLVIDQLDTFGQDDDSGAAFKSWVTAAKSKPAEDSDNSTENEVGVPIPYGEHDDTLTRYAAQMRKDGLSRAQAEVLIMARAADCLSPTGERTGWGVGDDPRTKVASAWRNLEPREVGPALSLVGAPEPTVSNETDEPDAESSTLLAAGHLVDGGAFVFDIPEGIPALWGADQNVLWAEGEALILAGPPGVGKTTIAHQVVAAMIDGTPVLGLPVRPVAGRILYLACDRPQQIARAMRRRLGGMSRAELAEHLAVWKGPPPADFAKDTSLLTRMCQEAGADVVIVDSLKDVALGLSDDVVGAGLNMSRQRALAAGIEVLELHHLVKRGENGATPTRLADLYGSAWISAGAGSVVLLWGEAGDTTVRLSHLKQPGATVGPLMVHHDHAAGTSSVQVSMRVEDLAGMFVDGMTAKAAAAYLTGNDKPSAAEIQAARRKCEAAVRDGNLVAIEGESRRGGTPLVWLPRCPGLTSAMERCGLPKAHADPHAPSVSFQRGKLTLVE